MYETKKSGAYRLYDFSMDQVVKLKGLVNFLTENGYMLIIILILAGFLTYYLLVLAIRVGKGLGQNRYARFQSSENDESR